MSDPKKFAKLKVTKSKDDVSTRPVSDKHLAGKIIAHNRKKLHVMKRIKKSIDFKETLVSVDSKDQQLAETTTSPALLDYISKNVDAQAIDSTTSSARIPFPTGVLTLTAREKGIYNGFFSDRDGQIIEKFDSQTVAIIAKNLQLKSLVPMPDKSMEANYIASEPAPVPASEQTVQMLLAAHDRIDMTHNRIDDLQRQIVESQRAKSIRIKYGDFELEIRKSIQNFVNDFKAGRVQADKDTVRKAISSWKKYSGLQSDQVAAKELMENWDQHQDSFCQFVDALSRGDDEQS